MVMNGAGCGPVNIIRPETLPTTNFQSLRSARLFLTTVSEYTKYGFNKLPSEQMCSRVRYWAPCTNQTFTCNTLICAEMDFSVFLSYFYMILTTCNSLDDLQMQTLIRNWDLWGQYHDIDHANHSVGAVEMGFLPTYQLFFNTQNLDWVF